ncbi:MAG: DUF2203 domain-containing protein [Planctomycetes bacterium]|jgi:hypothetical protein|nr:DUF2203 domain-containing protein [Planctomycetota bacterium]
MKRTYDLKAANQVLKLVRAIATELIERRSARRTLAREREQLEAAATPEGLRSELAELDARIWEHDEALRNCNAELEGLGMTVLRTAPLTVHIPGHSKSGPVVFCWEEGESSVCFGHPPGQEEHPRRPLRLAKPA